jgi:hypothetical protein
MPLWGLSTKPRLLGGDYLLFDQWPESGIIRESYKSLSFQNHLEKRNSNANKLEKLGSRVKMICTLPAALRADLRFYVDKHE